ncbi:MAG TPA: N-acetyltransferase [Acidimicrobiia bacterium]|jgi:hypothetical protein|nr:N-acetyltransferase [Acidimicrobiia bacterium]
MFVPSDFEPPTTFESDGFRLEPLGPAHNDRDYAAWTSSMEHIHATPGEWGSWPRPMTKEENLADLERHARDFEARTGFTYSVLDGDDVIGCLYIYPDKKGDSEAYVSSWVTASRAEMDVAVWRAVSDWLSADWPFRSFRYADRPT